ncbi:MAG: hypothetical protein ACP5MW_05285 [Thermoplasmata archaeon]
MLYRTWGRDVYRINIYALGEVGNRIIRAKNQGDVNGGYPGMDNRISDIIRLIREGKIDIFSFDDVKDLEVFNTHLSEIHKKDNRIEIADKFNLALFCSDPEAKFFYTSDSGITKSMLSEYLKELGKSIKEILHDEKMR